MSNLPPCLGLLGMLAVSLGLLIFLRYTNYKKTLALAEQGETHPEQKTGRGFLRWGSLIAGLGVALSLGLYRLGFSAGDIYPLHLGPWMLGGFVPLFLGLSLVLLHFLIQKD